MSSRVSAPGRSRHLGLCLLLALCCLPASHVLAADPDPGEPAEAWLVTYGPGEIYWQRFGHNAIWIRDPRRGLDHVFNFGFFDFAQQNFMLRFLRGRMLYFSAAQPAREEFAAYIDENRSIRAQRLTLTSAQTEELTAYLLREVRPENRDYRYDYYRNNCSTRVRDALDQALGGALSTRFGRLPAEQTWRDHTRRLTAGDFWLYLGLEIALGAPVDRPTNAWEEMFIPALLADAVGGMEVESGDGMVPLAPEDVVLFESSLATPAAAPRAWWPRYLLASLAVTAVIWLLCRLAGPGMARGLARTWFFVAGTAGLALLFLWFGTDHAVARQNVNLLVFNPLWLWPAVGRGTDRLALPLVAVFSLLAVVLPVLPPHQYTLDVLAAFLPLNLAAAVALRGAPRS
ncbi:MAG: DUF4105 domain-containing protein [Xanthomonadales bacterium]|jgi:hypothetical protein|nr:DUF4105 domain-containing protein [Xanthomonadales bacterium]